MISASGRTKSLEIQCSHCLRVYNLLVNPEDIIKWQAGAYIQDAMGYLSAGERELLLSRTCSSCFDDMFGSMEEDE